jgi:hypothetical protein
VDEQRRERIDVAGRSQRPAPKLLRRAIAHVVHAHRLEAQVARTAREAESVEEQRVVIHEQAGGGQALVNKTLPVSEVERLADRGEKREHLAGRQRRIGQQVLEGRLGIPVHGEIGPP